MYLWAVYPHVNTPAVASLNSASLLGDAKKQSATPVSKLYLPAGTPAWHSDDVTCRDLRMMTLWVARYFCSCCCVCWTAPAFVSARSGRPLPSVPVATTGRLSSLGGKGPSSSLYPLYFSLCCAIAVAAAAAPPQRQQQHEQGQLRKMETGPGPFGFSSYAFSCSGQTHCVPWQRRALWISLLSPWRIADCRVGRGFIIG